MAPMMSVTITAMMSMRIPPDNELLRNTAFPL
jgi:hypothetical protein